jgi:hypothetical protein
VRYELDFLCVAEKGCVSIEVRTGFFTCSRGVFPVRYELDFLRVAEKECVTSEVRTDLFSSREVVCFQRGTN